MNVDQALERDITLLRNQYGQRVAFIPAPRSADEARRLDAQARDLAAQLAAPNNGESSR